MHAMSGWIAFWDSDHSIYVNARHCDAHYRLLAADICHLVPSADATVLDFGCGEALHADRVAAAVGRLILSEPAPQVRARLVMRFKDVGKIDVRSPESLSDLPDHAIDLVILNSVAQYLTPAEFADILRLFRRLLKPQGLLVVGDVLRPDVSALTDVVALLRFAGSEGFLGAALIGLIRTVASDYLRLRSKIGLSRYAEADMLAALTAAGFSATRATTNLGHNPARMTFLARPA